MYPATARGRVSVTGMSERSLVKLVAIVLCAGAIVFALIGLPALLTLMDVQINGALIVNALAAVGSLSAAAVALWVATSDQRERKRERDAQDDAQSKLVVLRPSVQEWNTQTGEMQRIEVLVVNHGPRAIVDVTFVKLDVDGYDFGRLWPTSEAQIPVIAPDGGAAAFKFMPPHEPETPFSVALRGGRGGRRSLDARTRMTALVQWTDASGKTWERKGSGPLLQLGKPARIRP